MLLFNTLYDYMLTLTTDTINTEHSFLINAVPTWHWKTPAYLLKCLILPINPVGGVRTSFLLMISLTLGIIPFLNIFSKTLKYLPVFIGPHSTGIKFKKAFKNLRMPYHKIKLPFQVLSSNAWKNINNIENKLRLS